MNKRRYISSIVFIVAMLPFSLTVVFFVAAAMSETGTVVGMGRFGIFVLIVSLVILALVFMHSWIFGVASIRERIIFVGLLFFLNILAPIVYWYVVFRESKPKAPVPEDTEQQRQHKEYWKKVRLEEEPMHREMRDAGYDVDDRDMENATDETREDVIRVLMRHSEKKYSTSTKDGIYRQFASSPWLKGDLAHEVIRLLFRQFEMEQVEFSHFETDTMLREKAKTPYTDTDNIRWVIGLALGALIKPRLAGHKKYEQRLNSLLHEKKFNQGRSELVAPYARMAKEKAIPELIEFLKQRELLQSSIIELGRLKTKEAIPHLEKIIRDEEAFFRDFARRAIKKIRKSELMDKHQENRG